MARSTSPYVPSPSFSATWYRCILNANPEHGTGNDADPDDGSLSRANKTLSGTWQEIFGEHLRAQSHQEQVQAVQADEDESMAPDLEEV